MIMIGNDYEISGSHVGASHIYHLSVALKRTLEN